MGSGDDAGEARARGGARQSKAVLFDFSGTLARLEEDDTWFDGMGLDESMRAEVMDRITHPTATVTHHAWDHRDLDPVMHREAYLHVLRASGLSDEHSQSLYRRCIDPAEWQLYPDAAVVLKALRSKGIRTAVVSNIAWNIRAVLDAASVYPDDYILSFELGAAKPDLRIFEAALAQLGVDAADTLMVGDSEENDGAARTLGCSFALVDPLPIAQRPVGLIDALREQGLVL
ncbi:MAG: HAD-IA family hydrolase [Mycobacterium sp.]|nr:HAD-IA family hydrolase [Mycobacterium sp.]